MNKHPNLQNTDSKKISLRVHLNKITTPILLLIFFIADTSFAQRLMIETPSPGPSARFFYGQLSPTEFRIFEKTINLELDDEKQGLDDKSNPIDGAEQDLSSPPYNSRTLASMQIRPEELNKCLKSPRVGGFIMLISSLKGKVNSVKILRGADADSCAEKVAKAIESSVGTIAISSQTSTESGIKIELALQSKVTTATTAPTQVKEKTSAIGLTLEQIISQSRLTINEIPVAFNAAGWFAMETQSTSESIIELKVPGRKKVTLKAFPIILTKNPRLIALPTSYNSVLAVFSQKALKIFITDIPFLVQKTTIDGGAGGGLGYGREVPGEKRGERLVSTLGIEKRQIWGQFGLRANLLYTNAGKTVVPQTFTVRGTGFYDHNFIDESLVLRAALGTELFHSTIKENKNSQPVGTANDAVLIPSQVLTPLIGFSLHKIFRNGLILTPAVNIAPLYISSVGFYPALSPSLDIGYKIKTDLFALLSAGSEVHRFPSELGETKLQMDYLILTLKRGLQ
jgi:hypothetical protein